MRKSYRQAAGILLLAMLLSGCTKNTSHEVPPAPLAEADTDEEDLEETQAASAAASEVKEAAAVQMTAGSGESAGTEDDAEQEAGSGNTEIPEAESGPVPLREPGDPASREIYANVRPMTQEEREDLFHSNSLEAFAADGESTGFVPEAAERVMHGKDERDIADPGAYPYSAIVKLDVYFECCDQWVQGSGFLVDRDTVLTTADLLMCHRHRVNAYYAALYTGFRSYTSYYSCYQNAFAYELGTDFPSGFNLKAAEANFGIVRLEDPIGEETGWFGLQDLSDEEVDGREFICTGFSGNTLKTEKVTAGSRLSNLFVVDADIDRGGNGSAVWEPGSDGSANAVGIICAGGSGGNYARRITKDITGRMTE